MIGRFRSVYYFHVVRFLRRPLACHVLLVFDPAIVFVCLSCIAGF